MPESYAIIACDVFEEELKDMLENQPLCKRTQFLEMGLHDRPDILRSEVQAVVQKWEREEGFNTILLAYALCGNGLVGVEAQSKTIIIPRAHDCISVFLGGPEVHSAVLKENPGTYFYSPGWIRGRRVPGPDREAQLREEYGRRYPDDPEMVDDLIEVDEEAFSHHNCAAYVDLTDNRRAEEYCRKCAAHLGWEFKRLKGDPQILKDLVKGKWSNDRFLKVKPGQRIERSSGDDILMAVDIIQTEGKK